MYVEKSLCDLEAQYHTPEDRAWLKAAIVDSLMLRFFGHRLSYDFESEPYLCSEQPGLPHPQAQLLAKKYAPSLFRMQCHNTQLNFESGPRESTTSFVQRELQAHQCIPQSILPMVMNIIATHPPDSGERTKVQYNGIGVSGRVQANKAARQSLADSLSGKQAHFAAAGNPFQTVDGAPKAPKKPKAPKVPKAGYFETKC